jgi:hypothetical protein
MFNAHHILRLVICGMIPAIERYAPFWTWFALLS